MLLFDRKRNWVRTESPLVQKESFQNKAMGLIRTRNLSISQPVYDTISGLKCDNQFLYAHVTGNFMK